MSLNFSKIILSIFFALTLGIAFTFLQWASESAEKKAMWVDESWSLENTIRKQSVLNLLIHGGQGQTSPAPLDYFFLKAWDNLRTPLHSLGRPFNVYYRLHSILSNMLSGIVVVWIAGFLVVRNRKCKALSKVALASCGWRGQSSEREDPHRAEGPANDWTRQALRRKRNFGGSSNLILCLQLGLLCLALTDFLFRASNYHFSIEMRAYSLWNVFWFMIMGAYLIRGKLDRLIIILFCLLAFTTTASLFQIFAFAVSFMLVELFDRKKFLHTLCRLLKAGIIPLILCLYYISKVKIFSFVPTPELYAQYMTNFFKFWTQMYVIGLFSFLGILMSSLDKRLRHHTVVFLIIFILYAISPLLNYITLSRGVFFTHRQYRYYELIYPIFALHLAIGLPVYLERIKQWSWRKMKRADGVRYAVIGVLAVFLIGLHASRFETMKAHARQGTLKRLQPMSYDALFAMSATPNAIEEDKIKKYMRYYRKFAQYHPDQADAHAMMGFCWYHLGEINKARVAYEKAIELNPHFFWSYYNAGMLYLKAHEFEKAAQTFETAIALNSMPTMKAIVLSKEIYMPIVASQLTHILDAQKRLQMGYQNARRMMSLIQKGHSHIQKFQESDTINLEVF